MKICILMGSPRLKGNTVELTKPFIDELENNGVKVSYITLVDKEIKPCKGCYVCQDVTGVYGCVQEDYMYKIVEEIVTSDAFILATPIYSWYCTAEMKAVLDRHFGMNKFYRKGTGSLLEGKSCGIIATHGYDREYGAEPFETGIRRLCEHSNVNYLGMYSVRDEDDLASFKTEEAINGARDFARHVLSKIR